MAGRLIVREPLDTCSGASGDRPGQVLAKFADWLDAGAGLVWVIDPDRRIARVFRADGGESILQNGQAIDGESTLPGFSLPLARLFEP